MQFTGQVSRFLGPYFAFPYNGTAYLQTFPSLQVAFEFLDGSLFDMYSVDLTEFGLGDPPTTVRFLGYRPDGSFIATEFITAGIRDDNGRPVFHTFYFGPEFTGLNRIEIPSGENGYSLDNLVISIPEPGGGVLLLLGAGLVGRRWFSEKQR